MHRDENKKFMTLCLLQVTIHNLAKFARFHKGYSGNTVCVKLTTKRQLRLPVCSLQRADNELHGNDNNLQLHITNSIFKILINKINLS